MKLPARHGAAVVFFCDAAMFPSALFAGKRIADANGDLADVLIFLSQAGPLAGERFGPSVHVVDFDLDSLGLPNRRYKKGPFGIARLFIDRVLDGRYRRALYLDSDVFPSGASLAPLLELDLAGHTVAAVRDAGDVVRPGSAQWRRYRNALGLDPSLPFFNSGMLLIDLETFAHRRIGRRVLDVIAASTAGGIGDQAALNTILANDWLQVSPRWNWTFATLYGLTATTDPLVTHFIGRSKAWHDTMGKHAPRYAAEMRAALTPLGFGDFVRTPPPRARARQRLVAMADAVTGPLPFSRSAWVRRFLRETPFAV